MKRLLFIYNPQAGKGIVKNHLANIVDIFTKADYLVTVWPTQGKEDATRVAARQGWWYDRVVCCGGDGTLSETVFMQRRGRHFKQCGIGPHGAGKTAGAGLSSRRHHQ